MLILFRSFEYLRYNYKKVIIYFILIFVLTTFFLSTILIKENLSGISESVSSKLGNIVSLELDPQKISELEKVEVSTIDSIGSLDEVDKYEYTIYSSLTSTTTAPITSSEELLRNRMPNFNLQGGNMTNPLDMLLKKSELILGTTFTNEQIENGDKVAIISEQLALENGVSIDDSLEFVAAEYQTNISSKDDVDEGKQTIINRFPVTLKIIGIYKPNVTNNTNKETEEKRENNELRESIANNTIYVPNRLCEEVQLMKNEEVYISNIMFVLKSTEVATKFEEKAKDYLPQGYHFVSNRELGINMIKNIKAIERLLYIFMILIILVILIVTFVTCFLLVKERVYEIGVFLAIGMKKRIISLQMTFEILILLLLSFGVSLIVSFSVQDYLMNNTLDKITISTTSNEQVEEEINKKDSISNNDLMTFSTENTVVGMASNFKQFSMNFIYVAALFYFVIIILVYLGISIIIRKRSPKDILLMVD